MSNVPIASTPIPGVTSDRLKANVEKLFTLMLPFLGYMVPWEYRVTAVTVVPGQPVTVDAFPVDTVRCPHPPQVGIQVWKGAAGSACVPVIGSLCLLQFRDGNPSKPMFVAFDPSVPTVPPAPVYVPGTPLSLAGALTTFATGLNVGTLTAQATALAATLVELL